MARRTFFSFHYKPDVTRANVVKYSWLTQDREDAGFFDSSAFERAKRTNDDTLKNFINRQMAGSSVVCALVGSETASRRWVRYEIQRAIWEAKGLLAVRIHTIRDFSQRTASPGANPFELLGVYVEKGSAYLIERSSGLGGWSHSTDFCRRVIPKFPYASRLPSPGVHALSQYFQIYNWAGSGHKNIGDWIENAALAADR